MILSIEFTAKHIHMVEETVNAKSIVVKRFVEIPMPEGYLNGIVVNTAAVAASIQSAIKEYRIRAKKVIVTIGGADILHKELTVPVGNEKHTRGMIENELNKTGILKSEYLFDYILKKDYSKASGKENVMQNVDVYLMPRALVNNYLTTIRRSGLTAYRIETVNNSMSRLSRMLKIDDKEDMTVLCCAEEDHIGVLFVGAGNKMIYRSTQIKAEDMIEENAFIVSAVQSLSRGKDPAEMALEEIVENVSKLVQFHSQTGKGNKVGQILLYGDLSRDASFLERIENATGIPTRKCSVPDKVSVTGGGDLTCLNVIGASAGKMPDLDEAKDLDFFQLMKDRKKEVTTKKDLLPLAVGMGAVLIVAGLYSLQTLKNATVEASVQSVQNYVDDVDNQKKYQKAKALQDYVVSLVAYNKTCNEFIDLIKNTPRLEASDFIDLDKIVPANVAIDSYSYEDGVLSISCTTTQQDGASAFAKTLAGSGLYTDVKYTGFSEATAKDGKSAYSFQLVCTLWESQGGVSE